jgi:signal peptidase I
MKTEAAISLRKKLIENNHSVKIEAAGYSMFPFMLPGDEQTIRPVPMEDIAIGDVVVFEHANKWISHRVISIQNNNNEITLTLRGDTCIQLDPLVTKTNYIGKTTAFERRGETRLLHSKKYKVISKLVLFLGIPYSASFYCMGRTISFFLRLLKK